MNAFERKKQQERVEKSKEAVKRLNDFTYLKERREKNRDKNNNLRQEEDPEQLKKIARPRSPEPRP